MRKIILLSFIFIAIVGCASVPNGFDVIGQYNEGQFATDRNLNFIKLYIPESDDFNPKIGTITYWVESINETWEKRCEWHPRNHFSY